ncbi:uncharacterized protein LOC135075854 [Ostrinia nubilalis]|uniref:uncharacterized protein LOC135075854 n=1 Tax=Ostrinia nubilalis TaxID=29057 RepID=UPI003082594A
MNLKDIVWFLCAIALSTSKECDDESEYAYSSIYRSFDTPAITKKESKSEHVKISPAPEVVYISNPIYDTILTQEEIKPKPDEGAREITPVNLDNASNSNNQDNATANATEEKKPVSQSVAQNVSAMSVVPEMTNASDAVMKATPEVNASAAPVTVPAQTKGYTSPPLTMPIIQPGRLITPGLSAYASSKEDQDNEYVIENSDSESQESEESFDGFSMW